MSGIRVCILCGAAPNEGDSVGDFSWLLAEELSRTYSVSLILARSNRGVPLATTSASVSVHSVMAGWGPTTMREVGSLIDRIQPHIILVHFVPQLYGWNGSKPFFASTLKNLQRKGYPIVTVAHEFSAPFGPSPKLMLWASIHHVFLLLILQASRKVVLTTPFCLELFQGRFPRRYSDFHQIPITCPVPVVPLGDTTKKNVRRELGIGSDEFVLSTFASGLGVDSLFEQFFAGMVRQYQRVRLLLIGSAGEALFGRLPADPIVRNRTVVTGALSNEAVSKYLAISDLYAAFYPDGASSRRSSLMAGLAHGLPTVSNVGVLTDSALASSGVLHLLDFTKPDEGIRSLQGLYDNAEWRTTLGQRGRSFFERCFSPEAIGHRYARVLQDALTQ